MKSKLLLLYFLFSLNCSFSQITIDSFTVYNTGNILDSFNIKIHSNGQLFSEVQWIKTTDACGTLNWAAYFIGCETGQSVDFDTTFIYGFSCKYIYAYARWDTSSICVDPFQPTTMDLNTWDNCFNMNVSEINYLENNITLSPNPSSNFITISKPKEIQITDLKAFSSNGKRIPLEGKLEETIDISAWSEGVYFLQITTDIGTVRKKIIRL